MKNDDCFMRVHERRKVRSTICTLKCRLWAPTVDGRGMVSLATRQTPQIDDNTPARGGIIMYNGGSAATAAAPAAATDAAPDATIRGG